MASIDKINDSIYYIETNALSTADLGRSISTSENLPVLINLVPRLSLFTAGLVSSVTILTSIFFVKFTVYLNTAEMSLIIFSIQLILCLQFKFIYSHNLLGPRQIRPLLAARGLSASVSIIACYFSINLLKFSDAMSLRCTSLILTVVFASYILKEKLKALHFVSVALCFIGTFIIIVFSTIYETSQTIGYLLALLGAISTSSTYYFVKKQNDQRVHFSVNVFYFCLTGLIVSLGLELVGFFYTKIIIKESFEKKLNIQDISFAILAGLAKFFGHVVFTLTSFKQTTEVVAFYKLVDIISAFLLEGIFLGEIFCWPSVLGVTLILSAVGIVYTKRFFLFKDYMNVSVRFNNNKKPLVD